MKSTNDNNSAGGRGMRGPALSAAACCRKVAEAAARRGAVRSTRRARVASARKARRAWRAQRKAGPSRGWRCGPSKPPPCFSFVGASNHNADGATQRWRIHQEACRAPGQALRPPDLASRLQDMCFASGRRAAKVALRVGPAGIPEADTLQGWSLAGPQYCNSMMIL